LKLVGIKADTDYEIYENWQITRKRIEEPVKDDFVLDNIKVYCITKEVTTNICDVLIVTTEKEV